MGKMRACLYADGDYMLGKYDDIGGIISGVIILSKRCGIESSGKL